MTKGRLEAFSDGVIAILITIMVLELGKPDAPTWQALARAGHHILIYALSFVFLGVYWNNHHHLFHVVERVSGAVLWANLHLLFWLSLIPFVTGWLGENHADALPSAVYGAVMLGAAIAYFVLQQTIVAAQGPHSTLKKALGRDMKGKISPLLYVAAIALSFVNRWIADGLYVFVALMWLVPDRRIESQLNAR